MDTTFLTEIFQTIPEKKHKMKFQATHHIRSASHFQDLTPTEEVVTEPPTEEQELTFIKPPNSYMANVGSRVTFTAKYLPGSQTAESKNEMILGSKLSRVHYCTTQVYTHQSYKEAKLTYSVVETASIRWSMGGKMVAGQDPIWDRVYQNEKGDLVIQTVREEDKGVVSAILSTENNELIANSALKIGRYNSLLDCVE